MYVDENHHEHHNQEHKQHKQGPTTHSTANSTIEQQTTTENRNRANRHPLKNLRPGDLARTVQS